ncbi:hypothetical protein [Mycoplasma struthionis]|uniref:hypothetical protein n=1 Tax=Mycoplasma struthionis TaxID=538220 RepID=UPI001FE59824|nr:hypothetical protein [Mycoplasma struthionis]
MFSKKEDYDHPELVDVRFRKIKNWNYELNEAQVLDDMKKCKDFFDKYTSLGVSPQWDEKVDMDLIKYLACTNEQEWKELYLKWVEDEKRKSSEQ